MFIVAKICGLRVLLYTPWACLLREIHDSSSVNKADRQVVTDRHAGADSVMRTTEQTSVIHTPSASPSQMISYLIFNYPASTDQSVRAQSGPD